MHSYFLRVNNAHLKEHIERNYLAEHHHAYQSLILGLVVVIHSKQIDPSTIVIEDSYYNDLFVRLSQINNLEELMQTANAVRPELFLSKMYYLEDFIGVKYNPNKINYISGHYDSGYHFNVSLKQPSF